MKAIVTGANGFLGSNLVKKLINNGVGVLAIDISFENCKLPYSSLIDKRTMSIEQIDNLIFFCDKGEYELFYHFAWAGVNGPDKGNIDTQTKNIEMTLKCAEIANKLRCNKFLCSGTIAERNIESLSTISAFSPSIIYGLAKHIAHCLLDSFCKDHGQNYVWMQFSNIFGPNNKTGNLISYTINQLRKGEIASFGPAQQPYDFIYINDLIDAVYKLGINETNDSFYFIGSGTPMILSKYLTIVGKLFGRPDLIKIGDRDDDGIAYSFDMFNNESLVKEIGNYVTDSFENLIKYTIQNY